MALVVGGDELEELSLPDVFLLFCLLFLLINYAAFFLIAVLPSILMLLSYISVVCLPSLMLYAYLVRMRVSCLFL